MEFPLKILSNDEKRVLYKIFDIKNDVKADKKLLNNLGKLSLPVGGILQSKLSYEDIIDKIAKKNKLDLSRYLSVIDKEKQVFTKLFAIRFDELSEEEKIQFQEHLKSEGLSHEQIASITGLSVIGAAQLSGFGIYLLASSTAAAISAALGITLSFAFYTTMSTIIGYAISPLGILIAAIPLIKTIKDIRNLDDLKSFFHNMYKNGKNFVLGDYQAAELIFQYFASIRIMKIHELENKIKDTDNSVLNSKDELKEIVHERNKLEVAITTNELEINRLESEIKKLKAESREFLVSKKDIEHSLKILDKERDTLTKQKSKYENNLEKIINA